MKPCLEFPGAKQKPKNSRGFQKSMSSTLPVFFSFFSITILAQLGEHPCIKGCVWEGGKGGGEHLLFTHIPNIFAVNILSRTGKIPSILLTVFK